MKGRRRSQAARRAAGSMFWKSAPVDCEDGGEGVAGPAAGAAAARSKNAVNIGILFKEDRHFDRFG